MAMTLNEAIVTVFDDNGNPVPGALLYVYNPGTTTPRTVYTDDGLTIAHTQPIEADSAGKFSVIYLPTGTYKYKLTDANGVEIRTVDDVDPGLTTAAGALGVADGGTGATTAAAARTNLSVPSLSSHSALDTRISDLETLLNAPLEYPFDVETYSTPLALDFTDSQFKAVTLTGNITFDAPTISEGQLFSIKVTQDATGNRTATWNAAFKFPSGSAPAISRTANAVDVISGIGGAGNVAYVTGVLIQDAQPYAAPDVIIEDQKSSGTAGGTATSGSDETRTLNTLVKNRGTLCSLASNQFTLVPGTYRIEWRTPCSGSVNEFRSILYSVTATSNLRYSDTGYSNSAQVGWTFGNHEVTIAANTTYEIRQRVSATQATTGNGRASSLGTEIYSQVHIWKLA